MRDRDRRDLTEKTEKSDTVEAKSTCRSKRHSRNKEGQNPRLGLGAPQGDAGDPRVRTTRAPRALSRAELRLEQQVPTAGGGSTVGMEGR